MDDFTIISTEQWGYNREQIDEYIALLYREKHEIQKKYETLKTKYKNLNKRYKNLNKRYKVLSEQNVKK